MYCQKCGTQNEENARVCIDCDVLLSKPNTEFANTIANLAHDTLTTFKQLAGNPVVELENTYQQLESTRALAVGVSFGSVLMVLSLLAIYRILPSWMTPSGLSGFLKISFLASLPFISLSATVGLSGKFYGESTSAAGTAWVAGVACLPFALPAVLTLIFGLANYEIIVASALFGTCLCVLILFSGCTHLLRLSIRAATFAVPLCLGVSALLYKLVLVSLFSPI